MLSHGLNSKTYERVLSINGYLASILSKGDTDIKSYALKAIDELELLENDVNEFLATLSNMFKYEEIER